MNTPPSQLQADSSSTLALPDLQQAILDPDTLRALFRDYEMCAELLEVIPKYDPRGYVGERVVSFEAGKELLLRGELQALQVRYRYQSLEWWDTLLRTSNGVRLVRIQHDFSSL
jgi:hypothetical protein